MFTTAFIAMSLLSVNQQELETANEYARDQLIKANVIDASMMTDVDVQMNYLIMKNMQSGKKNLENFFTLLLEVLQKYAPNLEDLAEIREITKILTSIANQGVESTIPEITKLIKSILNEKEIEFLFAKSMDDTNQMVDEKLQTITQKFILEFSKVIQPKIEALISELEIEREN